MFKRALGTLAAAAVLVFVGGGCASTSGAASADAAPAEAAVTEVPGTLPEGAAAQWDFDGKPTDKITTSYQTFADDLVIPGISGSTGASLTLSAGSETKYLSEPDTFLSFNNKDSVTLENIATTAKASFTLKLDDAGTISVEISGNGDGDSSRIVAVADESGATLAAKGSLTKTPHETLTIENAPAGTYTIYCNGSRLHKVTVYK